MIEFDMKAVEAVAAAEQSRLRAAALKLAEAAAEDAEALNALREYEDLLEEAKANIAAFEGLADESGLDSEDYLKATAYKPAYEIRVQRARERYGKTSKYREQMSIAYGFDVLAAVAMVRGAIREESHRVIERWEELIAKSSYT